MYSQTLCLPEEGALDMHKYMPETFQGLELSQWHPEMKYMRPCHCFLLRMMSHQFVFVTMPRRWSRVHFTWSSKKLHVSWNSWSHILPCQVLQKKRFKSLQKDSIISCCSPEHQSTYGMTMKILYYRGYISLSNLSRDLANKTSTLVQSEQDYIILWSMGMGNESY